MDDESLDFGWTMGGQPGVIKAPNNDFAIIGKPAADVAKSLTAHWHPRIRPLFEQMNENEAAFWKITCSTPSGVPEWPNEARVTVIGDAVHSMTPAGGIGANTGVRDAALLGRLLAEAGGYGGGVTAAYEGEMRVYATEAVKTSYGMATTQFGVVIDEETSPTVG
jgi:2-polyprenyl-6-methoxyphenol hydroxylase-like FAD-dependent oxidoreductase